MRVCMVGPDRSWRAFLEPPLRPRNFSAYFGWHNFLPILKTKTFLGIKFCNKFSLSYLKTIVKDQLLRISRSQLLKWLFGLEKFSGLSRNGPQYHFTGNWASAVRACATEKLNSTTWANSRVKFQFQFLLVVKEKKKDTLANNLRFTVVYVLFFRFVPAYLLLGLSSRFCTIQRSLSHTL